MVETTQIGFGIQPGSYLVDIYTATFIASNSTSTSGTFNVLGTWTGGFGSGEIEISGQWIGNFEGLDRIIISNDITTSWTTTDTTLRNTSINLIENGGIGQTSNTISPIELYTTSKVPSGEDNRWRLKFLKNLWYSYDKNNPEKKYFFDDSEETSFASDHTYVVSNSGSGTFFDVSINSYYTSFGGKYGVINGNNIKIISSSKTDVDEASASVEKAISVISNKSKVSVTKISPTSYVEAIPITSNSASNSNLVSGINYAIPVNSHIGRNLLPCQTSAIKDESLSNDDTTVYKINCAPPGLFSEENYVISPNTEINKSWRYFYHLTSDESSVEEANDGSSVINNVRAEFPNDFDISQIEDKDNWTNGDLDGEFKFDFTYPITNYSITRNFYYPRESKMFAWSGKRHFGIIIGDPDSDNIKKYIVY